jgi:hypothetical protein
MAPIVADKHTPVSSRGVINAHFQGWRWQRLSFLVQAFCLKRRRVVNSFRWGYEYRNFDPQKPPRGRTGKTLADFSLGDAFGELRLWLGRPPKDLWEQTAATPFSDYVFSRDEDTTFATNR